MENEGDSGYYSNTGQFVEAPKKQLFRLQIPYLLRFAIIWTAFFIIAGVAIQYFQATDPVFMTVFQDFFLKNYGAWFKSFGSFADVTVYATTTDFVFSLLGHWYYFFYTGGLLSLIWGILSWIINWEFVVKKPNFNQPQPQVQVKEVIKPIILEKPVIVEREVIVEKPVPVQAEPQPMYSSPLLNQKINEWLESGLLMLSEGNVEEAEMIYDQISREYDSGQDMDHDTYKRILDFYYEISAKKKQLR
jgi:hypothetical protein